MIRALASLYGWNYPLALLRLAKDSRYGALRYLSSYWRIADYSGFSAFKVRSGPDILLAYTLRLGMVFQIAAGIWLALDGTANNLPGSWQFGTAIVLAVPIVWAHILALALALMALTKPKALGKALLCRILECQVRRLRAHHNFIVIAVAGSVGKTSTKVAIAKVLEGSRRVQWQEGNYNDRLTVPLIFFGQPEPNILDVLSWAKIILGNERIMRRKYPYQVVVAELGTDAPGQIAQFAYIRPDIAVITAVAPEHMEYFGTLDAIATEELSLAGFAKNTLINLDDVARGYLPTVSYRTYGLLKDAEYHYEHLHSSGIAGQSGTVRFGTHGSLDVKFPLLGSQGAKTVLAAVVTAHLAGLNAEEIRKGLDAVTAFPGRMQLLKGIHGSTIIDDSYNSSPAAALAALEVLSSIKAPQRIALLGSMNELGEYSAEAHRLVAEQCDPKKLDLVLTLGPDANKYLAPLAKKRGCAVKVFWSPYEAGQYIAHELKDEGVVLVKGSQNRVFAEEAIKTLLADKQDAKKLVRQSAHWMGVKRKQFRP